LFVAPGSELPAFWPGSHGDDHRREQELRAKLGDKVIGLNGRPFGAVDLRTKTVYEFKSGIDPKPSRLKVDPELVKRGWRVVYAHDQEPDPRQRPGRCPDFCSGYDLGTHILAGQRHLSATGPSDGPILLNTQG